MLNKLVKQWISFIGINELSDNDSLNIIRKFKLDKLPPQYLLMLKMISPPLFMIMNKLNEETIDWGNLDDIPGFDEDKFKNDYAN
tara:strand:- start:348 stop:602 length:255 start_codon:yes stop_codon:yes gene_type:complete